MPLIAACMQGPEESYYSELTMVDPCAGEGEAIIEIAETLNKSKVYACELETTRHETLKAALSRRSWKESSDALQGDAFMVDFGESHASCLYLNPPYDLDPVHGRLEHKFLNRFASILGDAGLLVFVVPHYALKASAEFLAKNFEDIVCLKFPKGDFEVYKQVVLFGRRCVEHEADPETLAQILKWSQDASDIPVLGKTKTVYRLRHAYFSGWKMRQFDRKSLLASVKPWQMSSRAGGLMPVPHVLPEGSVHDLMFRQYQIATHPRPAHIAAGIASGLFNGRKVSSENPKLPELLVKGVFDREYVTVEEKHNKDGDVTGVVQVQQPKLVTTVLDLTSKKYTTLKTSGKSDTLKVADMSIEDLLDHYGPSLMKVMSDQCPVSYDPKRDSASLPLAASARDLFRAQADATKALVSLLGGPGKVNRTGKAAILLGEIGSGKTSCALTLGRTIAKRMLVMCPPHLLDTWRNETRTVFPNAEVRVLEETTDVDAIRDIPADKFVVAVLSRETAKLGHGWEGVTGFCPKCGGSLPLEDLAKKRSRCTHKPIAYDGPFFDLAKRLSLRVSMSSPQMGFNYPFARSRFFSEVLVRRREGILKTHEWSFDQAWVQKAIDKVSDFVAEHLNGSNNEQEVKLLCRLLLAVYDEDQIEFVIRRFGLLRGPHQYYLTGTLRQLGLLLKPGGTIQNKLADEGLFKDTSYYSRPFSEYVTNVQEGKHSSGYGVINWTNDSLTFEEDAPGSLDLAKSLVQDFWKYTIKSESDKECGEPLFQAVPSPRRYPLAKYITKNAKDTFDFLVLDEGHEYATDGSAQERAAHRLTALGLPTLLMTGSIMNGYAASLFANMWAISPDFRAEFGREDKQRFIDRYGYRKRLLSEKDRENGEIVAFGSTTDRVERSERIVGDSPGILPLFLFRHLLKYSVTLHKADLALDLPKCHQIKHEIQPSAEVKDSYDTLLNELRRAIKKDRFDPEKAGKLFGALAELPSYLDRATTDTGNQADGSYEIRYPESLDRELVATGKAFSPDTLSAKEEWMLETIKSELEEGRNVMVFCWHVSLLPRIARIISEAIGEEVPVLYTEKVPTAKRQAWIDAKVVKKGRRVLVANPVGISTGLNNLVHFSSEIWHENPACNPFTFRQAIGRVDRIGQKRETRIHVPVFAGTLQVQMYDLLMRKVSVSTATDGLDPESSMRAAGIAEDSYLTGLSIGKTLWAMMGEQ